jgi:uncharacterized membrane protein
VRTFGLSVFFDRFASGDIVNHLPGRYLSVYVPTAPNPTGGYFVMLKSPTASS